MSYYNIKEILNENNLFNIIHISLCTQIGTFAPKEKEIISWLLYEKFLFVDSLTIWEL